MRITALIENTRLENRADLTPEHGLSFHIRRGGEQLLFDTGASEAYARNARRLEIDINDTAFVVLSHHHYDHGGGLNHFLATNGRASVYLREGSPGERIFRAFGLLTRRIGLDPGLFENHPKRFVHVRQRTEISPGVFLLTDIPTSHPTPRGNRYLCVRHGKTVRRDPFDHELIMVIREEGGLVVFTGCSHNGILNMVDAVVAQFPDTPINALFGGFHLVGIPKLGTMAGTREEVLEIGETLLRYPIVKLYTGHCTGPKAFSVLKEVLGDKLEPFPTGRNVEV